MSTRKDWEQLAPRSRAQYERTLQRAFGKKSPSYVPEYSDWPETTRQILRAALQAYWKAQGNEEKGIVLASKIKRSRKIVRAKAWPTMEEADRFMREAERTAPRQAFLIVKLCERRGFRAEEVLSTPRSAWESAVRWGRLTIPGEVAKGGKERILDVRSVRRTIEELLATPGALPHDKAEAAKLGPQPWGVLGEVLARSGSSMDTHRHLLTRYMKRVAEAAGLDPSMWHPHTLRHVFSDRYLASGGSERGLQEALGHASLETLIRYTHPTPETVGAPFRGD